MRPTTAYRDERERVPDVLRRRVLPPRERDWALERPRELVDDRPRERLDERPRELEDERPRELDDRRVRRRPFER